MLSKDEECDSDEGQRYSAMVALKVAGGSVPSPLLVLKGVWEEHMPLGRVGRKMRESCLEDGEGQEVCGAVRVSAIPGARLSSAAGCPQW